MATKLLVPAILTGIAALLAIPLLFSGAAADDPGACPTGAAAPGALSSDGAPRNSYLFGGDRAEVEAIAATIRERESGGDYDAHASGSTASGAYQFTDDTWDNYAGYRRAHLAPPAAQDAKAVEHITGILAAHGNDIAAVPVVWYLGYLPPASDPIWDRVPAAYAGNTLTPRQYQATWLDAYAQRAPRPAPAATSAGPTTTGPEPTTATPSPTVDAPVPTTAPVPTNNPAPTDAAPESAAPEPLVPGIQLPGLVPIDPLAPARPAPPAGPALPRPGPASGPDACNTAPVALGIPPSGGSASGDVPLASVEGITVHADIATHVAALIQDARAAGYTLTGSGYRSHQRQVELRRQHCGASHYAIYEMPSSQCSPPTARPGSSNHEQGLAIDLSCNGALIRSRISACFHWLTDHAPTYGLHNLPSEPWHWSNDGS